MLKKHVNFPIVVFLCAILFAASCTTQPQPTEEPPAVSVEESPQETEIAVEEQAPDPAPAEEAAYMITFTADWSADTHPDNYAASAHFSPFIALAHNANPASLIYTSGETASPGMKDMAETGATALLEEEINAIISAGGAAGYVRGSVFDSPGSTSAELTFTQAHNQITFVSMIAPSPDWFVSVQAVLFEDGEWVDEVELPLASYDAGTDSGPDLTSEDAVTNPPEDIRLLPDQLQGMGTVTLMRVF